MRYLFYDDPKYKTKQSEITHQNWMQGRFNSIIKELETRLCRNPNCNLPFKVKSRDPKIYCSHHCSAIINNQKRLHKIHLKKFLCRECNKPVTRSSYKYCSLKCQHLYQYKLHIEDWKNGQLSGSRGIKTRVIANYVRNYLMEKYNYSCSTCSWNKPNPITSLIPLEVNHIDGNSENNDESNLNLLCPNCHSLTPNFRNLNKGKGRTWRLKSE